MKHFDWIEEKYGKQNESKIKKEHKVIDTRPNLFEEYMADTKYKTLTEFEASFPKDHFSEEIYRDVNGISQWDEHQKIIQADIERRRQESRQVGTQ